MHVSSRILSGVLLAIGMVCICAVPGIALAHGGHVGPTQTFTEELGPYSVAITVEIPPSVPAPLYLDIAPQNDMTGATLRFRAVPRGQSFTNAPVVEVQGFSPQQDIYLSQLDVDRFGDWDLEVRVDGPLGASAGLIPFTITATPLPAGSLGLFVGLGGLGICMIGSIVIGGIAHQRSRPVPRWVNWLIGQVMFACLIVAAIFGWQQFAVTLQSANAQAITDPNAIVAGLGRPHVNLILQSTPALPRANQPMTLTLNLSDGATGRPIEDLVPHHDALIHLVVLSDDGGYYAHIHPPRVALGRYAISLTPDRPGRYTIYAEIERQDSGSQVLVRHIEVSGTSQVASPIWEGFGEREVDGLQVKVSSSLAQLQAGKQATFTFTFSEAGHPVTDMQPWLGMAGHLVARSADEAIFAHVHAIEPMAPSGVLNATTTFYGPDIRFVYTFPQPGRYQIWAQFRHAKQIVTIPMEVTVD